MKWDEVCGETMPALVSLPLQRVVQEAVRTDFSAFVAKCFGIVDPGGCYAHNWHIDCIAHHLEAVRQGEVQRLIINLPPRHLKSICVSVAWPAFLLGHNPAVRVLAASYATSLSVKHSLDTRLIIQSDWYRQLFPKTRLAKGQVEKQKFVTTQRGFRLATSVGGSVTGEGGDILIVDDPLKPLHAESALLRKLANRWFDHTFSTRLNDRLRGGIVVVMHDLNLASHIADV